VPLGASIEFQRSRTEGWHCAHGPVAPCPRCALSGRTARCDRNRFPGVRTAFADRRFPSGSCPGSSWCRSG
jgi:hypothetical protein